MEQFISKSLNLMLLSVGSTVTEICSNQRPGGILTSNSIIFRLGFQSVPDCLFLNKKWYLEYSVLRVKSCIVTS
jgi:hypothetical protein